MIPLPVPLTGEESRTWRKPREKSWTGRGSRWREGGQGEKEASMAQGGNAKQLTCVPRMPIIDVNTRCLARHLDFERSAVTGLQ